MEALEAKGFSYAYQSPEVKKNKLSYMKFTIRDGLFITVSALYVCLLYLFAASYTF
ncbi:hypothetical protein D3C79_932970 [compost metagenome]